MLCCRLIKVKPYHLSRYLCLITEMLYEYNNRCKTTTKSAIRNERLGVQFLPHLCLCGGTFLNSDRNNNVWASLYLNIAQKMRTVLKWSSVKLTTLWPHPATWAWVSPSGKVWFCPAFTWCFVMLGGWEGFGSNVKQMANMTGTYNVFCVHL